MTEISLDIDTNQRKGLGPFPMQHHKTSCSWYAWQSNIPNSFQNPCTKTSSKTEPSDRFNYRIDRLVNSKKILSDSIKKSCYSDSICKVGNDERNIVPVGEARNYNTFAFSQHDNRHKIKLPAKKHGVDKNIVIQSKSDNVSDTLSWTNTTLPDIESSNNKARQRAFTSSAAFQNPRREAEKEIQKIDFRRFPKSHNFSQRKNFQNYKNANQKSPILTHDMTFNSKNDNYLMPKSELMSLQNLVQPQNYSGASIPSRDKIRSQSRGDGTVVRNKKQEKNQQPWSYAFNLKTHSALIEKNTKYACFRF